MKVLHVYRTYFPDTQGGVQETVRQISLGTSKLGVSNRIFTPSAGPHPAILNHPEGDVHRVKLNFEIASCGFCITGIPEFKRCVQWADIVHYHFPWPFADALHFMANVRKPTLVTYHSDVIRQRVLSALYSPVMKRFLQSAQRIVCTSPNYLASSKVLNALGKTCGVIPIGLNRESYPAVVESELSQLRQQHGEGFFLFVGLLRYYKGLHTLLDAALITPYKIVIVGAGPLEKELKQKVRKLGLANVHFTGYIPDTQKMALIKLCRALVLPSNLRSEAFGVCLLEGAMNGKPLISTEVGTGTSFVNIDSETGYVVPSENAPLLADAMNKLGSDSEHAEGMGKNALARFESVFTSKQMADAYLHEYKQLTNSSS
ncbi:MAG: glycosyltransferase [Gammaproteobacteria bacterium]|nr:glycosyltransferase [Gammaproteobacteria bacterium]